MRRRAFIGCLVAAIALLVSVGVLYRVPTTSETESAQISSSEDASVAPSSDEVEGAGAGDAGDFGRDPSDGTFPTSYASLPEDSYAANTVLVMLDEASQAGDVSTQINGLDFLRGASIDASDASAGFIKVSYAGGTSAGEIADMLGAQGFIAQPNFLYYLLDEDEPSVEASNADAEKADIETAPAIVEDEEAPLTPQESAEEAPLEAQASASLPNDTYASLQWTLGSIYAPDAWTIKKTNKSVTVATIDSGCNVNHEDLRDNIVGAYDTQTGGTNVTDEQNHGTHVAGIIAAKADNKKGIAGVSYNAGLYIVRALHKSGNEFVAESSDVLKAFDNIIANRSRHNIRVINMSLGSARNNGLGTSDLAVMRKIDEAYFKYGILTVAAAGNRESNELPYSCYPSDFSEGVIGVINMQQSVISPRFTDSNYNVPGNRTKPLSAPGTNICSTVSNGGYEYKTGTSMAAPCVAGVAALVFATNPNLTPGQVVSVLCSSTTPLRSTSFDDYTGYGEVNAYRAVQLAKSSTCINGADSVLKGSTLSLSGGSSWSSDKTSIASVSASGQVRGVKGGYATISAQSNGSKVRKTVTVYDASISGASSIASGKTTSYSVSSTPSGVWNFSSSNSSVASITQAGVLTARAKGSVTITATLASNSNVKVSKTVTITDSSSGSTGNPMYRMYNPNSGEHFYTANAAERDMLKGVGWRYEGIGWTAPSTGDAVYRMYNPNAGEHHYTLNAAERDMLKGVGWRYEDIGWYSDKQKRVPLYRQYNPNEFSCNHNYTTNKGENDYLVRIGWRAEGIGWYGM